MTNENSTRPDDGSTDSEGDRSLERMVEALLFASDAPLPPAKLASILGGIAVRQVNAAIEALRLFYGESGRSYTIVEVAGGFQLTTLPEFASLVSQLFKSKRKPRLTQPALETLAIIAYKQPASRLQIESIRGVNCEGVLATLIERDLVAISGRAEAIGKPYLYSTTKRFLEYLGLKDYRDLPSIEELERAMRGAELAEKPLVPPPAGPEGDGAESAAGE